MHLTNLSNLSVLQQDRLKVKVRIEKERRARIQRRAQSAPSHWREWLPALYPNTFKHPFSPAQSEFWNWIDAIQSDIKPDPSAFFAIWPRGSGKTTSAETAVTRVGAKETRKFVLYVRSTQDKANESVGNIASLLESKEVGQYYPALASRKVGKYGHSRGWRLDMLRCANGFNVLALGLDAAVRGVKLEDYRPDLIVFDDIDDEHDSPKTIAKKIDIITKSIIPAGASHCAYVGVQNLIHANSIFSQVVESTADFLHDRHVSGPHPAVENLTYEAREGGGYTVTGGSATWAGQPLETCEKQINEWGISAFLREAQHEVEESGGIWEHVEFRHVDFQDLPDLIDGQVWVDPAVTSTDDSDCHAIGAGGVDAAGAIYIIYGLEQILSPEESLKRAILKAVELKFSTVGVETDQGGDLWRPVYMQVWKSLVEDENYPHITEQTKRPRFRSAKAGAGHGSKVHRNSIMLADYERGQVVHVRGTHTAVERALRRFPNKPLDMADMLYWLWFHLQKRRRSSRIL